MITFTTTQALALALSAGLFLGPPGAPIERTAHQTEIAEVKAVSSVSVDQTTDYEIPLASVTSTPPPVESSPVDVVADEVTPQESDLSEEVETITAAEQREEAVQPEAQMSAPSSDEAEITAQAVPEIKVAPVTNVSGIAGTALEYAGVPYVWGGATPAGWDCSGFVQWVYAQNGIHVPRGTSALRSSSMFVPTSNPKPGDLVFQNGGGHVGIYIGGGQIIGAQNPSVGTVIRPANSPYGPLLGYYTLAG